MSFFDKKQDVIDVKLTQFGKNLLARGAFRPVFYQFFDDDILYNSERAGFSESQKRTEERINEAVRLKAQHNIEGVEDRFEQNQNMINSGSIRAFMELNRRQDPLATEKLLKYPVYFTKINAPEAPYLNVKAHNSLISSSSDNVTYKGVTYDIPQLNFSSSYGLFVDRRKQIEVPDEILEYQTYIDMMSNVVGFLDESFVEVRDDDIVLSMEEVHTDSFLENFELEVYEVDGQGNHIRLTEDEVDMYFDIQIDDEVEETPHSELRDERFDRRRK